MVLLNKYGQNKMKPGALDSQDHAFYLKTNVIWQNNSQIDCLTILQHKQDKAYVALLK